MNHYMSIVAAPGLALLAVLFTVATPAPAHETDQYSVPIGREFADLRFEISDYMRGILQRAVDRLNARIRTSLDEESHATASTAPHYAPGNVAAAVFTEFPIVMHMVDQLNLSVLDGHLQRRYPGLVTGHLPVTWIYSHWLLVLDVTKLARLGRSAMLQIDGVLFGTDKIVHFAHMGYLYYGAYRDAMKSGASEAQALKTVVELGTGNHPFLSERTLLGETTTGVFSNADLAANYMGLFFYRNLTAEVTLKGRLRPPLLTRDGPFWRLNDQVRGRTDFFADFVSPHWNEAYNPSVYGSWAGTIIREALERRCGDVLRWYTHADGTPRTREEFQRIHQDLRWYYGADYGAEGDLHDMVTIANTCFAPDRNGSESSPPRSANAARREAPGRGGLWERIRLGDVGGVAQALQAGAAVNAPNLDGERPLHVAARLGQTDIARMLLGRGAMANVASSVGLTPLHVAVRESRTEVVHLLLQAGANVGAFDSFGCVPLHDAAVRGDTASASILLAAGAGISATDGFGTTPLHLAARHGQTAMVDLLLRRGADAGARNQMGRAPADEAAMAGHHTLAKFVKSAPATPPHNDLVQYSQP